MISEFYLLKKMLRQACSSGDFFLFAFLAGLVFEAAPVGAEACEVLPEAKVCEASTPWKNVTEFPWGPFTEAPRGEAAVFHLDGRGFGVIQRLPPPHFDTAVELADWWVADWFERKFPGEEIEQVSDRKGWEAFETTVRFQQYIGRKTRFKYQGRVSVVRFSFVRTEVGELVAMSWLNEKMNAQAGEYLHSGLLKSISFRD